MALPELDSNGGYWTYNKPYSENFALPKDIKFPTRLPEPHPPPKEFLEKLLYIYSMLPEMSPDYDNNSATRHKRTIENHIYNLDSTYRKEESDDRNEAIDNFDACIRYS